MRTLAPTLALAAMLALVAPRAARAGSPAGVRARATDCGSHHRRRRRHRRRHRRTRRRHHVEKKKAPPAKAAPQSTAADTAAPAATDGKASGGGNGSPLRRSRVMEFDARLVQGQTASSGAVYLFNRAPRRLPPLLKLKQSYLHLIVDPVLGPDYHDKKGHR